MTSIFAMSPYHMNRCRGLMLDSHPTLFDGTLKKCDAPASVNSVRRFELGASALRNSKRNRCVPRGWKRWSHGNGSNLTRSQVLRILLARMIVTRPQLLIFNGSLHNIEPHCD